MPYTAEISRNNPSCFLFLIDQSRSMRKPFGNQLETTKSHGVADAINRLLQNLVLKCTKSEGTRDYFHVGVIGYGAQTGPAFGGALSGEQLVPISRIANTPLRLEERVRKMDDGAGGILQQTIKFPVWFEPKAKGKTPMCQAFVLARQAIEAFLKKFPVCYPPLIINITDGRATDGSPEPFATVLKKLGSKDGNVLLFNARLSSTGGTAIEFPYDENSLPDDYARILFRMSSLLPVRIQVAARNEGLRVNDSTRGFVCNADLVSVIRFLDIGTKAPAQAQLVECWVLPSAPSQKPDAVPTPAPGSQLVDVERITPPPDSGPHEELAPVSIVRTAPPPVQWQEITSPVHPPPSAPDVPAPIDSSGEPLQRQKNRFFAFLTSALIAISVVFVSLFIIFKPAKNVTPRDHRTEPAPKVGIMNEKRGQDNANEVRKVRPKAIGGPVADVDPFPECELVRKWLTDNHPELQIEEWLKLTDVQKPDQPDRPIVWLEARTRDQKTGQHENELFYIAKQEVLSMNAIPEGER